MLNIFGDIQSLRYEILTNSKVKFVWSDSMPNNNNRDMKKKMLFWLIIMILFLVAWFVQKSIS
ncbi:hypothetical protein AM592_14770 [Bacillus gobiensis]|uniref:Uncharacterized protein n=2 Tax=Bacillus TaxID=1386 RepID=A0A0M3RA76_9BACI|nr:hypothetical protein AM592_14770 [Bacillus gobiensis]MBP1081652.1 hypothetical protein [Bacillus capparidis]